MKIFLQEQLPSGYWHQYERGYNQRICYIRAQQRASRSKRRNRLVDDEGRILDIILP
tara:strand:+ start:210 stop:380 length:171 start_codon:yes stop_codon:yes gene_type:complete